MLTKFILVLSVGFSIVSALVLIVTYSMLFKRLSKSWLSLVTAVVLLSAFLIIQILHFTYFEQQWNLYFSKVYSSLIILTAPAFYFFVKDYTDLDLRFSPRMLWHLTPLLLNFFIANRWSIPVAFLIGSVYAIISVYQLIQLKDRRQRFRLEVFALFFCLVVAIAVFALGAATLAFNAFYFIAGYSMLIGLSFLLVIITLLLYPDASTNLTEAAEKKYAKTTLTQINREAVLQQLKSLMTEQKLFRDETLNLGMLAEQVGLTSHQLSELINGEFGTGFSRYIREHRIMDAQRLLLEEPESSILSVSLSTGFTSQSSFYTAFGQLVGESPGNYRKRHLVSSPHTP